MSVIVKGGGDFTPAPEGVHPGVCVDVVDKGMVETPWGQKRKIAIVWEIEAKGADGKPFLVSQWFTASLTDKANLSKMLQAWRGKAFTPEELQGFDVEKVIGAACQLVIVHAKKKDGSVRGNVTAVVKADPNKKLVPSGGYIRQKDRPENQKGAPNSGSGKPEVDNEIPF